MRRVAVTGLGVLAPNGIGVAAFADALWCGRGAVSTITAFDASSHAARIAAQLPDNAVPGDSAIDGDDRLVALALAAAGEAVANAGIDIDGEDPTRFGVTIANAIGGTRLMAEHFGDLTDGGRSGIDVDSAHPALHRAATFNTASAAVAEHYGFEGPCVAITTGCTGGNDAIGFGYDVISRGEADVMVAGAAEAPITPLVLACFEVIGALSVRNNEPETASRPFDMGRDGFVLGEGAGVAVLEEWEHARHRGATIYAEVVGFGTTANAFHMTDLPPDGADLARSFQLALDDARLPACDIDYINAHGSSTPQNDVCETNAIKSVLGEACYTTPVSSIKSMVGHALAAANAIEFVASVLALGAGVIPPTINLERQDPRCDLDYVANEARTLPIHSVASLSSGFGGIHSTVILTQGTTNGRRLEP